MSQKKSAIHSSFDIKGCDSNFEVKFSPILKVTTNQTTTLH